MQQRQPISFLWQALSILFILLIVIAIGVIMRRVAGPQLAAAPPTSIPQFTPTIPPTPTAAQLTIAQLCPDPTPETMLYISQDNGYCFLYPRTFTLQEHFEGAVAITAPQHDSLELSYFFIQVLYTGSQADLVTANQYAQHWIEVQLSPEVTPPVLQPLTIDGRAAVELVAVDPSTFRLYPHPHQSAFIVADGHKYRIMMEHHLEFQSAFIEEAQQVWQTITSSIMFFPPTIEQHTVSAVAVCPSPTEETTLQIVEPFGYCYLAPADFEPDTSITGALTVGPVLDVGNDVRARIAVNFSGTVVGMTLDDVLGQQPHDIYNVHLQTVNEYPAVTFIDPTATPGPLLVMKVLVDEYLYTIWAGPYDLDQYPAAAADLDRAWQSITESLRFFTLFR